MGDVSQATIFVGVQIKGAEEVQPMLSNLSRAGFSAVDLSQNEIAKTHTRHMVGGRSKGATHERLFHFDFPERKGALANFLDSLGGEWNISIFHYRNHGSDRGRVLAGIQVPPETELKFQEFLKILDYEYTEETDNPALKLFL